MKSCFDSIWLLQFPLPLVCIIQVPLATLDSQTVKNLIGLSRTLVNVMGEYFANEIVK